jgi:CBS domain containing-hemolysin-like protein
VNSDVLLVVAIGVATLLVLFFSSLTYSLRDFSRAKLTDLLEKRGQSRYLEPTVAHASDLIFVTAVGRLLANILVLVGVLRMLHDRDLALGVQYLLAVVITLIIGLVASVMVPHAIARHAAEPTIATFIRFLHGMRLAMFPVTKVMHGFDALIASAAEGTVTETEPEKIEQEIENEILSAVEEGEKEGVVDEEERRMIESVIAFHDTQVGQIMTSRPEIYGLEIGCTLETVKARIEESGHSRIPVYKEKVDQIVGILYARDLIKFLGQPGEKFNIADYMRPAIFVPETKPLRDLLKDFRLQKVHIAIVSDEYGGTAGLVTIEDIFEELVGDISDEHEPTEPAMLTRLDELSAEADARIYIDELNRVMGLNLPEDAGYDTLGGFVTTTAGRIPAKGTTFEHNHVKYTVLDAEPQKVNRVKIEVTPQPVGEETTQAGT